ncbi:MAG: hypothetical protein QOC71_2043 [Thermoplasmata archaeon]|nr:hypothetical protein [Thermoplasmata archaeon]
MPYTSLDTPAILRRIDADLASVVAAVRAGDRHVRSIVLTGGFARGEGAVLRGDPQNDYDLVAIRGFGRPAKSYAALREELSKSLGLHIDLAAVPAWRLQRAPASVFWYETALRGRVLWGEDLLGSIRVRDAAGLDPCEGLRLLANRAAGLLLATARPNDADALRLQAAKALLAAFDAQMLAAGRFAPSQTERWHLFQRMLLEGPALAALHFQGAWLEWAYESKRDPGGVADRDPGEAWQAARRAILVAIPSALRHASLRSLDAYGRKDSLVGWATYAWRAGRVEGARRLVTNPTGQVRVATLRLLEATPDGKAGVALEDARRCLAPVARNVSDPLRTLEGLRAATLQ